MNQEFELVDGVLKIPDGTTQIPGHILQKFGLFNPVEDRLSWDDTPMQQTSKVRKVIIPASVTQIDPLAFSGVTGLEEVAFEEGSQLKSVGASAFMNCENLKRLVFPAGVESIDVDVIRGCRSLEEVVFSQSSTVIIGKKSFEGCSCLKKLHFLGKTQKSLEDKEITNTESSDNQEIFDWNDEMIEGVNLEALDELSIPNGITNIEKNFIKKFKNLKYLAIPGSIRIISFDTFKGSNLEEVIISEGIETIEFQAFQFCHNLKKVKLPNSLKGIYQNAFSGCEKLKQIDLPNNLKVISREAFAGTGLQSIAIPEGIIEIEPETFANCSQLRTVKLPETLKIIFIDAFIRTGLQEVVIGKNVGVIADRAFASCKNLKSVKILGKTLIGDNAFAGTGVENVELSDDITTIKSGTFDDCTELVNIKLPRDLTEIESYAFWRCKKLETIQFPDNLREIKRNAFAGTGLQEVDIPKGIDLIGEGAFSYCKDLKTVIIEGNTYMADEVFAKSGVQNLELGKKVERIGKRAFKGCRNLKTVNIPRGVRLIEEGAFLETGLTRVLLNSRTVAINAFDDTCKIEHKTFKIKSRELLLKMKHFKKSKIQEAQEVLEEAQKELEEKDNDKKQK